MIEWGVATLARPGEAQCTPCAPSTWRPAGSSCKRSGGKVTLGSRRGYRQYGNACRCPRSEFINRVLYYYCWREGITFTRGRAWKKNDSALVEQKNGAVVRHLVGYDRFTSKPALAQLARVYVLARLHVNFFQPVEKLVTKHRVGARVHRVFDRAQTPYQRVCAAGVLSPPKRAELDALYHRLNPLELQRDLEVALERLWKLAAADPRRAMEDVSRAGDTMNSVTVINELTAFGG